MPDDLGLALALKVFAYTETLQRIRGGVEESLVVERAAELESQIRALARQILLLSGYDWRE